MLPPAKPFPITAGTAELELLDRRSERTDPAHISASRLRLFEIVEGDVLRRARPGVHLCTARNRAGYDPRLPIFNFAVRQLPTRSSREAILGALVLYNCVFERGSAGLVLVRAMPIPGFDAAGGLSMPATWARVLRSLLERDLELDDGTMLDVVEYSFPATVGHEWKSRAASEIADEVVDDLAVGQTRVNREFDGSPLYIRRASAPRRESLEGATLGAELVAGDPLA